MDPKDPGPLAREVQRRMTLLEMNAKHVSRAAGVGVTYVSDILKGRSRNPRHEHLAKVAEALGATVDDLMPHRPKMGRIQVDELAGPDTPPSLWSTAVTEIDVYAGMGAEGGLDDQERTLGQWRLPTDWLRQEVRGDLSQIRIITLEGDSMAGTLEPGDKVVVDLNRTKPSPPGLFVIYDGMALVAKRLYFVEGSNPPTVRIISDNVRYAEYARTMEEVNIVGRIMGRWQRLS